MKDILVFQSKHTIELMPLAAIDWFVKFMLRHERLMRIVIYSDDVRIAKGRCLLYSQQ